MVLVSSFKLGLTLLSLDREGVFYFAIELVEQALFEAEDVSCNQKKITSYQAASDVGRLNYEN